MSQVFISYRQTDDEQRQRVRAFGERLRGHGIDVVLDECEN
jgi:SEFIR domain